MQLRAVLLTLAFALGAWVETQTEARDQLQHWWLGGQRPHAIALVMLRGLIDFPNDAIQIEGTASPLFLTRISLDEVDRLLSPLSRTGWAELEGNYLGIKFTDDGEMAFHPSSPEELANHLLQVLTSFKAAGLIIQVSVRLLDDHEMLFVLVGAADPADAAVAVVPAMSWSVGYLLPVRVSAAEVFVAIKLMEVASGAASASTARSTDLVNTRNLANYTKIMKPWEGIDGPCQWATWGILALLAVASAMAWRAHVRWLRAIMAPVRALRVGIPTSIWLLPQPAQLRTLARLRRAAADRDHQHALSGAKEIRRQRSEERRKQRMDSPSAGARPSIVEQSLMELHEEARQLRKKVQDDPHMESVIRQKIETQVRTLLAERKPKRASRLLQYALALASRQGGPR